MPAPQSRLQRVPADDPVALREAVSALQAAGIDSERINVDRSATNGPRPFLTETLTRLTAGDRLLVPDLASLARSTGELAKIVRLLDSRGVHLWVGGRRFAALNAADTVELVAQMSADLLCAAESEDRQRAERFRDDRRGQWQQPTAVESLRLREQFDTNAVAPNELVQHWKVSRATMYRAIRTVRSQAPANLTSPTWPDV